MDARPYAGLDPDTVLGALEASGFAVDGRLQALNSFENRVYLVGLDSGDACVAKFYRPGRLDDEAILEEHALAAELVEAELPVAAPIAVAGRTLLVHAGFRLAVYPRLTGRAPELDGGEHLEWLGRLLARMHAIGALRPFRHRATFDAEAMVRTALRHALDSGLLPSALQARYQGAAESLADEVARRVEAVGATRLLRLHGDCHPGNLLWNDSGPQFVDLDDAVNGPAVQDLWLLLPTDAARPSAERDALLEGYSQFRDIDPAEFALVPALRAARLAHFAGWIAARWQDPAFPPAFPYAAEARWWEEHVQDLLEAAAALADPL
ncbi:MAG TPA: serine/threonine protein kinase [Xanthomonadaceae bacterium]|nr:serine/threonine protein kinase [Xanthomonadaceae bacterium]